MTTADTSEITSPLDLDNPTAVAFLRWVYQDSLADLAEDTDISDEDRRLLTHFAKGFTEAADLLAAQPDSPLATIVLGYAFDEGWRDYQEHLAGLAAVEAVDEHAAESANG